MIRALAEGVKETIEAGWFFSKSKDISARAAAAFAQGRRSVVSDTRLTRTTAIELTQKDLVALTSFEAQDSTKHHGPLRTDPQGNVSCVVLPVVFTHKATAATSKKVAHCTATVHNNYAHRSLEWSRRPGGRLHECIHTEIAEQGVAIVEAAHMAHRLACGERR